MRSTEIKGTVQSTNANEIIIYCFLIHYSFIFKLFGISLILEFTSCLACQNIYFLKNVLLNFLMKVLIQQKKNTYEVELFFELLTVKYGIFSTTFG